MFIQLRYLSTVYVDKFPSSIIVIKTELSVSTQSSRTTVFVCVDV